MSKPLKILRKRAIFLITKKKWDDKRMLECLEQYEGLVNKVVSKYNFYDDYDDLYQAGMIGLMRALQKYDSKRESDFLDYAYLYVKGEVLKTLNSTRQVKISPEIYQLQQEIRKTGEDLLQSLGREATSMEIAYVIGCDESKVDFAKQMTTKAYSLDEMREEDDLGLYNRVAKIEMGYDAGILDLKTAIAGLEQSEQMLINSRYYEDMTQSETASFLGVSQVQVSRQERKILNKLKSNLLQ